MDSEFALIIEISYSLSEYTALCNWVDAMEARHAALHPEYVPWSYE